MITIALGRAAQFLLALAMMRVATTLLTPVEMGKVSLILSTISFFALFLLSPVGMFINRRLHSWQKNGVALHYLIYSVNYVLLVTVISAVGLYVANKMGLVDIGIPVGWLLILVCGSLFFNTLNQVSISALNLLGYSGKCVLLSVATIMASLACATILILTVQTSAQHWFLGVLLGQLILGLIGMQLLIMQLQEPVAHAPAQTLESAIHQRNLQALYRFAWPVAIAFGLAWVQGQGYRYLMEGQLGLAQLGMFVAGYGISAGILAGFESVLTTYFQPRLYRDVSVEHPEKQVLAWQRYATAMIPSLLLTVALVAMLAPELTYILLGERFQAAVHFVIWGALAEAARVLTGIYSMIAHVYMRTHWLILPNLIGAVLAIALCTLLIPALGATGAGLGLALSGFAVVIIMHISLRQQVNGGPPLRPVLMACLSATVLWGMTQFLRQQWSATGWELMIGVLVFTGVAYLGLQYVFLKGHLEDYRA